MVTELYCTTPKPFVVLKEYVTYAYLLNRPAYFPVPDVTFSLDTVDILPLFPPLGLETETSPFPQTK
jgi:hypothetical protein